MPGEGVMVVILEDRGPKSDIRILTVGDAYLCGGCEISDFASEHTWNDDSRDARSMFRHPLRHVERGDKVRRRMLTMFAREASRSVK